MAMSLPRARLVSRLRRLSADCEGGATAFGLFITASIAIVGGLAIDVTHAYSERTRLQVAADVAAHAALLNRWSMAAEAAKANAIDLVQSTMPTRRFGDFIQPADLEFGILDPATRTFVANPAAWQAVRVSTTRLASRGNPVDSFLSHMIGVDSWDIRTPSVFTTYLPPCFREGFTAEGEIHVRSNNAYRNGFCLHSNTLVTLSNNNFFEAGTAVSVPDMDSLDIPASGFEYNEGLDAALRLGTRDIREVRHLESLIAGLSDPESIYFRDYITSGAIIEVPNKDLYTPLDFPAGGIYRLECHRGPAHLEAHPDKPVLQDVVLLTNCQVKMDNGLGLENAVIATTSTDTKSISGSEAIRLGRIDDCAPGGGAQLLTLGGVSFAAEIQFHGGQIIARGSAKFTANAIGIGVSIIAGGTIDATSNMDMTACDGLGMEDNLHAYHYRLAG